jgi:hypothetical protein
MSKFSKLIETNEFRRRAKVHIELWRELVGAPALSNKLGNGEIVEVLGKSSSEASAVVINFAGNLRTMGLDNFQAAVKCIRIDTDLYHKLYSNESGSSSSENPKVESITPENLSLEAACIDQFLDEVVIQDPQYSCFYHFTDERNLPLIRSKGLLSRRELRKRSIVVPAPAGNKWSWERDDAIGMDRFVHLCFMSSHPMEYRAREDGRIGTVKFISIRPEIIKLPGVLLADRVANKRGAIVGPVIDMLGILDIDVMYNKKDWSDAANQRRRENARKFEILVPDGVPKYYLQNIDNG